MSRTLTDLLVLSHLPLLLSVPAAGAAWVALPGPLTGALLMAALASAAFAGLVLALWLRPDRRWQALAVATGGTALPFCWLHQRRRPAPRPTLARDAHRTALEPLDLARHGLLDVVAPPPVVPGPAAGPANLARQPRHEPAPPPVVLGHQSLEPAPAGALALTAFHPLARSAPVAIRPGTPLETGFTLVDLEDGPTLLDRAWG